MDTKNSNSNKVVGVIGLGAMGTGISQNLINHGKLNFIYNRTIKTAQHFNKKYNSVVTVCETLDELATHCNVIFISISTDKDILDVVTALLPTIQTGTVIVDTSTIGIDTVAECNRLLAIKNSFFLDAPVSGGSEGAKNGELVMMVGGEESILNSVTDIIRCFTKSINYMGSAGSGQKTKAVNQIMAAGINQAVTEALAFARISGIDNHKLVDVISAGAAGNWFLEHRGKSMLEGNYSPGFKVKLHHKDLLLCNKIIEQLGENRLPIIEMTLIHYQRLMEQGFGDEDISALFRTKQQLLKN